MRNPQFVDLITELALAYGATPATTEDLERMMLDVARLHKALMFAIPQDAIEILELQRKAWKIRVERSAWGDYDKQSEGADR